MGVTMILCAFLAANIALCGLAWGQSQDCPVQRNNLLSEYTCAAGDVIFIDNQALTSQNPGPRPFTPQNRYVSTHLTFPCNGYIQTVEIQAQGDQDLQNVAVDLHLWRKKNSSILPFEFQLMKKFPTTNFTTTNFTTTLIMPRFFVLSANVSEEQFYFNEGDILGFEIPANVPINVTSSPSPEPICHEKNMTYLLSANCCNCTPDSSVCDEPRIRIRIGSPSSSTPLPISSPTPGPATPSSLPTFSVPSSMSSPPTGPAGGSQMIPDPTAGGSQMIPDPAEGGSGSQNISEPMSPTNSSQPDNAIFIILGATLGSAVCAALMLAIIVMAVYIHQRYTQPTVWRHNSESKFKSSSTGASNPLSINGNTRLERLASVRHQHAGTTSTTAFECQVINDHYYDAPMEAIASYHSQLQAENTHFYHVLESPSPPFPASPTRAGSDSQSASSVDSPKKYLTMYPPGSTPASTGRGMQPLISEEEDTSSVGYHRPTELESYEWRKNKSENEVDNIFYEFTGQSATQQSQSNNEVINTFYQASEQQKQRVEYDIPVELMGKTTENSQSQVFKEPTDESWDQTAATSKQLFHHESVMKGEGEQQTPVHFYHTLEPTVEDEITGHPYHILEPDGSEDGSKSFESHQVFEFGIYVPDTEERKRLTGGRGELIPTTIYDDWSKKQREESTKKRGFFEPAPAYWKPAEAVSSLYDQLSRKKFREILREQLVLEEFLGNGQFGSVSKATWTTPGGSKKVAVKIMRPSVLDTTRVKFLQEAAIMGQFFHSNVVKLHGVVSVGEPAMIVLELMPFGDLAAYLKKNHNPGEKPPPNPRTLLSFCRQVACGMGYLSRKGFVHRDLAARNILLNESLVCKISDFGMSRELEEDSAYYISRGGNVPIKWTAPEALVYKKYSTASDVYSYGMLLYEIWSLGLKPLANFRIAEVPKKVSSGYCQPPPPGCPREIYQLMVKCWNPAYSARPTFGAIFGFLNAPDEQLLKWSEEDRSTMSYRAAELGAPLTEGSELYKDLQFTYQLD